ncbi:hypothetical protein COCON_G00001090 [Conger conger]|uniref:Uncharacterized protein n=1 Tax=Conger conger TaxID=82655 RepID=A0A9Q1E0M4_CONCO|nr:hypothetical protein COCON_G00001090 [Conger conger]
MMETKHQWNQLRDKWKLLRKEGNQRGVQTGDYGQTCGCLLHTVLIELVLPCGGEREPRSSRSSRRRECRLRSPW